MKYFANRQKHEHTQASFTCYQASANNQDNTKQKPEVLQDCFFAIRLGFRFAHTSF